MPDSLDTLAADSERAMAADELRRHYDSGRLTLDEFESRLAEVHAARTRGDLNQAFRQLPRSEPPASFRVRDIRWSSLALQYGLINVVCMLVWLFSELRATSGPSGSSSGHWFCISAASAAAPAGESCRRPASTTARRSLAGLRCHAQSAARVFGNDARRYELLRCYCTYAVMRIETRTPGSSTPSFAT